jgi:hypothetical protein
MRAWLILGVVTFFTVAAIVLAILLAGQVPLATGGPGGNTPAETSPNTSIALENAHLGTTAWQIPQGKEASTQIQAYAGATSVLPGQKLTFYVSTQKQNTPYSVEIYRLGWYGGAGGRLMASQAGLIGHAQGYYDATKRNLVDCNSCSIDKQTGLVEANWQPSYVLHVLPNWTTGIYLAKFIDITGMQTYAPFDVAGTAYSTYIAVTPDTTYAAYDDWGGYSLYDSDASTHLDEGVSQARGVKVSFNRPYIEGQGSSQVLLYEIDAIRWLERQGYDLSYISDVDLHKDPRQLLHHKVYLSLGHDEYWTKEMRDGVEAARDAGVSLAFLGANASYWQMRFEPDRAGHPDRTVVCYKVESVLHDLALDPFYGKDNSRVTTQWRDPLLARPENALIGIMYSDLTHQQRGFPWVVNPQIQSPLLDGTGLQPGQHYGCGLVGYEWDRIFTNGATPAGLQVLAVSATRNQDGIADTSNTTYYIAPSGAMVFATGSIYWASALDSYRFQTDPLCANQGTSVLGIQKLMARFMQLLAAPQALLPQMTHSREGTLPILKEEAPALVVVDFSVSESRFRSIS